jgi:monofunctional biosynthetic peptidoglycan transglycosylase
MTWYRRWRRRHRLATGRGLRPTRGPVRRILRYLTLVLAVALLVDLVYVATIWPDWNRLKAGPIPKSSFMLRYERQRAKVGGPPLQWQPVSFDQIPADMRRAAIVAEDARFYDEDFGVDFVAIWDALRYNLSDHRVVFGGSTIAQQTTKNLFLSPARTALRKWHELLLTLGMEYHLSKDRILELYLNIAQFGPGIYGVEAAAENYWGIHASELNEEQAAELAASLPDPVHDNPATRGGMFEHRVEKILYWMHPPAVDNPPGPGSAPPAGVSSAAPPVDASVPAPPADASTAAPPVDASVPAPPSTSPVP